MRAVIDWSHDLLDVDERALFRTLCVFVGGFDLAAAVAVSGGDAAAVADVLGRLVDKNLVAHQRRSDTAHRWRLLETVRAYALERLADGVDEARVRERHRAWALASATAMEAALDDTDGWRAAFDLVVDDLRSVADQAGHHDGCVEAARSLAHLLYARRFLTEARARYELAARHADPAAAAVDLRRAADVALVEARGDIAYRLLLASAERARDGGDGRQRAISLAYAVTIAGRAPAEFAEEVPRRDLDDLVAEAGRLAPADDERAAAYLAGARMWIEGPSAVSGDLADAALIAARRAGDATLESAALDAVAWTASERGRYREAYGLGRQRLDVLARLPRHDPRSGWELFDVAYMNGELAVATGDLAGALAGARAAQGDDVASGLAYGAASRLLIPLVLIGEFDEALDQADLMWTDWIRAGGPAAGWMAPAAYALTLVHGVRGDADGVARWRERSRRIAGDAAIARPNLTTFMAFVDARVALHTGDPHAAGPDEIGEPAATTYRAYALVATAERDVAAGRTADRLAAARAAAAENDWATAAMARIDGRRGDASALRSALAGWERIGSRFERACTLLLMDGRRDEGLADLAAMAIPPPAER
jgi:hypothetical protein